jgi:hypothetical protein
MWMCDRVGGDGQRWWVAKDLVYSQVFLRFECRKKRAGLMLVFCLLLLLAFSSFPPCVLRRADEGRRCI